MADLMMIPFIALILYGGGRKQKIDIDIFGIDNSNSLKAIFSVIVLFGHAYSLKQSSYVFCRFNNMGAFACAMFFFISGFGLLCQYKNKENYLESFIRKRFSKILVPAIIVSGIYFIFKFLLYDDYTVSSVFFSSIEGHTPIVDNSWYIIELIVLYLMFYLTFRMYDFLMVKKNLLIIYPIMVLFVLSLLLVVFFVFINWGSNWYISTLAFPLGCYVASEKDKIASFINIKYVLY